MPTNAALQRHVRCPRPHPVVSVLVRRPGAPGERGANDHLATIERSGSEPALLFLRVPEDKIAENRLHLDLDCDELESARRSLEGLGATFVHEKHEYGLPWMTFQDPEGNEFCVAAHA